MASSVTLSGLSGRKYVYVLAVVNRPWLNAPGNYVFLNAQGWPVYVGETKDFSTRMPQHDMWAMAQSCGACTIAAHQNLNGEVARQAEEADLIRFYNPVCNTQQKLPGSLGLADVFGRAALGRRGK